MLKQILISSLIAIAVSILIVIGFYNLIPLSVINPIATDNGMFGTSITTISGSDTVQNALKVIANDNFTALNAGKIENATTSLPLITDLTGLDTIGTITTGVWNATALTVAYGGTGSTTLSLNQILLGNGTGILKTVSGFGTSGQFLTSAGNGSAPAWTTSSIDEGIDYNWTGTHTFATTTQFSVAGGMVPSGTIISYAASSSPAGWLYCNGASLATSSYSDLFSVIGYNYGGSGASFNIPDLRGRQPIGFGSATSTYDVMGETGGEDSHVQTIAEMAAHTHTNTGYATAGETTSPATGNITSGANTITSDSTGSSQAFNVLDPYIVLYYIIKY